MHFAWGACVVFNLLESFDNWGACDIVPRRKAPRCPLQSSAACRTPCGSIRIGSKSLTPPWKCPNRSPCAHLSADPAYTKAILAIGRGGKKPRKDFAVWADVKPYLDFFFDDWFQIADEYPENFDKTDIKTALTRFLESFDIADDMNTWFDKIKAVADSMGYASDMKAYRETPDAFRGNVADVSMFLRVAVTGKLNSPDMYAVMQVLGEARVRARIEKMLTTLA